MADFSSYQNIVIKVGTSTIAHSTGLINIRNIENLVKVASDLKNMGKNIIIVSSGAIGVGLGKMGISKRPKDTPSKQAAASVGQCELMYIYDKYFSEYNHTVSQVLLTGDVIDNEARKQNVINTFNRLKELNVIAIVNENDTVATEEIEFGDNDTLSAIVSELTNADVLILFSDIDGLYDKNPKKHPDAKLVPHVYEITDELYNTASGSDSNLGTGGMVTKLNAAKKANETGIDMYILNGSNPFLLYDLLDGKECGTCFHHKQK